MNDRPFGFDTLTIHAVLVTDGDPASARTAAAAVGFDAVRLPAVLVPPGGPPPAGDYVMLGLMTRPLPARRAAAPSDARENSGEAAPLPKTRYRKNPGHPPTPGQGRDPLAVGIETWQGMAKQGRIARGTWQSAVEHLAREGIQINDFSVASQDTVAKWIIRESHAMDQVRSGDLDGAIARLRRQ